MSGFIALTKVLVVLAIVGKSYGQDRKCPTYYPPNPGMCASIEMARCTDPKLCEVVKDCTSDADCSGEKVKTMCCRGPGCNSGLICTKPITEMDHFGECISTTKVSYPEEGCKNQYNTFCKNDATCSPDQKCCNVGCGKDRKMCYNAVTPDNHVGTCPYVEKSSAKHCASIRPMGLCDDDTACTMGQKCCSSGCPSFKVCKDMNQERSGTCPAVKITFEYKEGMPISSIPIECQNINDCDHDSHCQNDKQKCCKNHCGLRKCTLPK